MRINFVTIITVLAPLFALSACDNGAPAVQSGAETAQNEAERVVVAGPERVILAFGDSLFAGYNLGEDEGYPEQLEAALRARGINARVVDGGVSGDTTAAGAQRIAFLLDQQVEAPDLVLVELGGNDMLRALSPEQTRANLTTILEALASRDIPVLVMGMRAPPNLGADFQAEFDAIYPALAEKYDAELVPFFLEPVYDQQSLLLPDRIHPTAEGVSVLVEHTLGEVIEALPPAD